MHKCLFIITVLENLFIISYSRSVLPNMLPEKARFLRNLENLSYQKSDEELTRYDAIITNDIDDISPSQNWTEMQNETSKLTAILTEKLLKSNKVFQIVSSGSGLQDQQKELVLLSDSGNNIKESSTENRNQSRDDYLLVKEDYSDYEDYYEYNEADYDDLDSDNIHQLQSEDGFDAKLTNSLIYMIQKEKLKSKLRRLDPSIRT